MQLKNILQSTKKIVKNASNVYESICVLNDLALYKKRIEDLEKVIVYMKFQIKKLEVENFDLKEFVENHFEDTTDLKRTCVNIGDDLTIVSMALSEIVEIIENESSDRLSDIFEDDENSLSEGKKKKVFH